MLNTNSSDKSTKEIPIACCCPITMSLMEDPVVAADGHTYDRTAFLAWIKRGHRTSPETGKKLEHILVVPNITLKHCIQEFKESEYYKQLQLTPISLTDAIRLTEKRQAILSMSDLDDDEYTENKTLLAKLKSSLKYRINTLMSFAANTISIVASIPSYTVSLFKNIPFNTMFSFINRETVGLLAMSGVVGATAVTLARTNKNNEQKMKELKEIIENQQLIIHSYNDTLNRHDRAFDEFNVTAQLEQRRIAKYADDYNTIDQARTVWCRNQAMQRDFGADAYHPRNGRNNGEYTYLYYSSGGAYDNADSISKRKQLAKEARERFPSPSRPQLRP